MWRSLIPTLILQRAPANTHFKQTPSSAPTSMSSQPGFRYTQNASLFIVSCPRFVSTRKLLESTPPKLHLSYFSFNLSYFPLKKNQKITSTYFKEKVQFYFYHISISYIYIIICIYCNRMVCGILEREKTISSDQFFRKELGLCYLFFLQLFP